MAKKQNILVNPITTITNTNLPWNGLHPPTTGTTTNGYMVTTGYVELNIGNGKLIEENGDLIWVKPNGTKFNLTGKEASFNKLYERLKD